MHKEFSSMEMLSLLHLATRLQKVRWTRISDYLIYNGRNKALLNFVSLFTQSKQTFVPSNIPHADLMQSFYCEYRGVAFCLMNCQQRSHTDQPPTTTYKFMIQCDPFDNFGYYDRPDNEFQEQLNQLIIAVREQLSLHYLSRFKLNTVFEQIENEVKNYDPEKDVILTAPPSPPPYKYCCVIDSSGYYVTFVLVLLEDSKGNKGELIQYYTLKDGERLIDADPPHDMVKPLWTGSAWKESATKKEINEYHRKYK